MAKVDVTASKVPGDVIQFVPLNKTQRDINVLQERTEYEDDAVGRNWCSG